MTTIQVSSVLATVVPVGFIQLSTATRATTDKATGKKKVIDPANRARAIIVPELVITGVAGKFEDFLRSQLHKTGEAQLSDLWQENGNNWAETDSELWTTDALLAYAARKNEGMRLNGELVKQAFEQFVLDCIEEPKRNAVRDALVSCAAPTPDLGIKKCEFLIENINAWLSECEETDEEFQQTWVHRSVMRKLTDRLAKLREMESAF